MPVRSESAAPLRLKPAFARRLEIAVIAGVLLVLAALAAPSLYRKHLSSSLAAALGGGPGSDAEPDFARVRMLVARGAPVNGMSDGGTTPLMVAARDGDASFARQLLD